jgi:hypothetical protein
MRVLTATGIIDPVGEDVYAHTRFSLAYLDGAEVEFFELWYVLTYCQSPVSLLSGICRSRKLSNVRQR